MKHRTAGIIAMMALSACAVSDTRAARREPPLGPNASAFVQAELAFARDARDRGQWTAFRAAAAREAEMFVPGRVRAQDWLKGRADPPVSVRWWPERVVMACDGSVGVTTGGAAWPDGTGSRFVTVWARDRAGGMRWVLNAAEPLPKPPPRGEAIATEAARCGGAPPVAIVAGGVGEDVRVGAATDRTLQWRSAVRADGALRVTVARWDGTAMVEAVALEAGPGR